MKSEIQVRNATANNLRGVSATIPLNSLTCIVGRSGSGKSSFAIDVLLRSCLDPNYSTASNENVVIGAPSAVAVRQRLAFELSIHSAANALGFPQLLRKRYPVLCECSKCDGKGVQVRLITERAVVDNSRSLSTSALHPLLRPVLSAAGKSLSPSITTPAFSELSASSRSKFFSGIASNGQWKGLQQEVLLAAAMGQLEVSLKVVHETFFDHITCPFCYGSCLADFSGDWDTHITDFAKSFALQTVLATQLLAKRTPLAHPVSRLSAGELQWLRILSALKDVKAGMLVLLDEPTAGMCKCDSDNVVSLCQDLVKQGCTVVVVEHSPVFMAKADYILEFGPGGGADGGRLVFSGTRDMFLRKETTMQKALLELINGYPNRNSRARPSVKVQGTKQYGLGHMTLALPERKWTCIAGPIGVGKSGCIDIVYRGLDKSPGAWIGRIGLGKMTGHNNIRRPHLVDQGPIGLNSHSIPMTYIDAMNELRKLFASMPTAQKAGFGLEHFSFNTEAGRCVQCSGYGFVEVLLSGESYWQPCGQCGGLRYRKEVSQIEYKGLSIGRILKLTVSEAEDLFADQPLLARKLNFLNRVGLGYLVIGQPSNSLSGGEAQRVKVARQLAKKLGDRTLYLLDTPSRGLSLVDSFFMVNVFRELAVRNTVIIADNHAHFVRECDWLIVLQSTAKGVDQVYGGPPADTPSKVLESITGLSELKKLMTP